METAYDDDMMQMSPSTGSGHDDEGDEFDKNNDNVDEDFDGVCSNSTKQCFSKVQSKKFWAPLVPSTCQLCPSMDLVVLGIQPHNNNINNINNNNGNNNNDSSPLPTERASTLWLHRTVSWQKLSTLSDFETSENDNDNDKVTNNAAINDSTNPTNGASHVAWSPDGRLLALARSSSCSSAVSSTFVDTNSNSNVKVLLYHVEAMVSCSGGGGDGDAGVGGVGVDGSHHEGRLCDMSIAGTAGDHVVGLTWAHVGRPHPQWRLCDSEREENDVFWTYRSRYLDRSVALLPPSDYHWQEHRAEGKSAVNTTLPTCKTPLSILCVQTHQKGLHLYLHGRYRILTLPPPVPTTQVGVTSSIAAETTVAPASQLSQQLPVMCSPSLTHIWVHTNASSTNATESNNNSNLLSLYSIPTLSRYRYHLQTISSLCCSITCHLESIRKHATEVVASYKSSLKPLDTKLEGLVRLLKNYGIVNMDMRAVMHKYILVGHTSSNASSTAGSDLSNAMDQFFTSVAMNDQLLQRLERSLQGAVANVETMARTGLLSPARALLFNVGELHGLARFASSLLSESAANALEERCAVLLVSVEYTLTQLIEARFRLRDLVAWLRSTGSEIKARGTAINSAQRENAKKRRVSQATVQRMLSYLQSFSSPGNNQDGNNHGNTSITESLLGIPLVDLLHESPSFVVSRCPSPTSAMDDVDGGPAKFATTSLLEKKTPTILYATKRAEESAARVFEHPRVFLSQSVHRMDFVLPSDQLPVAIHTRVGSDGTTKRRKHDNQLEVNDNNNEDSNIDTGFFSPKVDSGYTVKNDDHDEFHKSLHCRQWSIIAKCRSNNSVDIYVVPLGWAESLSLPANNDDEADEYDDDSDFDDDFDLDSCEQRDIGSGGVPPFYLTAQMVLPDNCRVMDIAFYGDDGKSSLSSGADSGTGKEGRQALGLLVSSSNQSSKENQSADDDEDNTSTEQQQQQSTTSIELWLLKYDGIPYGMVSTVDKDNQDHHDEDLNKQVVVFEENTERSQVLVRPLLESQDYDDMPERGIETDEGGIIIYAKTRQVDSNNSNNTITDAGATTDSNSRGSRLILSGSRGIGGVVFSTSQGVTSLELFDLEEDEEEDSDEEDDEEMSSTSQNQSDPPSSPSAMEC